MDNMDYTIKENKDSSLVETKTDPSRRNVRLKAYADRLREAPAPSAAESEK